MEQLLHGGLVLLQLLVAFYRYRRLARSGIADIDRMSGGQFEQYLAVLFRTLGYHVERTGKAGDYGADLVISRDGVRTIVQAKRYTKNVGVKAVQEAVTAKAMYRCSDAMVVTNSYFTKQAQVLARSNAVALWDRERLIAAILHTQRRTPAPDAPPHVG
jgi:restriction system protein